METWKKHKTAEVMVSSEGRSIKFTARLVWVEFRFDEAILHAVKGKRAWKNWTEKKIKEDIEAEGIDTEIPDSVVWLPEPEPEPEPAPQPQPEQRMPAPNLTPTALNLLGIKTLDPEQPRSIWAGDDQHTCPVCNSPVARKGQNCGSYSCKRTLRRGGHRTYVQQPRKAIDTI